MCERYGRLCERETEGEYDPGGGLANGVDSGCHLRVLHSVAFHSDLSVPSREAGEEVPFFRGSQHRPYQGDEQRDCAAQGQGLRRGFVPD